MKSDREQDMERYPDEFQPNDDFEDEETDEYLDCHMDREGFCGKAGSEECEFDCPYRAEQRDRERKRRSA